MITSIGSRYYLTGKFIKCHEHRNWNIIVAVLSVAPQTAGGILSLLSTTLSVFSLTLAREFELSGDAHTTCFRNQRRLMSGSGTAGSFSQPFILRQYDGELSPDVKSNRPRTRLPLCNQQSRKSLHSIVLDSSWGRISPCGSLPIQLRTRPPWRTETRPSRTGLFSRVARKTKRPQQKLCGWRHASTRIDGEQGFDASLHGDTSYLDESV